MTTDVAITVNSPYSGMPVKVRDQDVRRAVRDEEGRVFYVLPKSDGSGFWGSMTRAGGEKQERNASQVPAKAGRVSEQAALTHSVPYDVTGRRRRSWRGVLVILILMVITAVLVYLFSPSGPFSWKNFSRGGISDASGSWKPLK